MSFEELLTECMEIIEVYKTDPDQPLPVITDDRIKLATYLLELQIHASDAYESWDTFDRQAEVKENQLYLDYTGTIPEKKALVKTNEEYNRLSDSARDYKAMHKRLESFIRRGDAVLEGMKQKISNIKKDMDNVRTSQTYS
jgi:hypothetical protein